MRVLKTKMKVYLPLNKKGIEELEKLTEVESENLKIYKFNSDDYFYLDSLKYFDFLNVECDCIIDLYESEDIPNEKLNNALRITKTLIYNSYDDRFIKLANIFINIFETAIKSNTFVHIYCYGVPRFTNG